MNSPALISIDNHFQQEVKLIKDMQWVCALFSAAYATYVNKNSQRSSIVRDWITMRWGKDLGKDAFIITDYETGYALSYILGDRWGKVRLYLYNSEEKELCYYSLQPRMHGQFLQAHVNIDGKAVAVNWNDRIVLNYMTDEVRDLTAYMLSICLWSNNSWAQIRINDKWKFKEELPPQEIAQRTEITTVKKLPFSVHRIVRNFQNALQVWLDWKRKAGSVKSDHARHKALNLPPEKIPFTHLEEIMSIMTRILNTATQTLQS